MTIQIPCCEWLNGSRTYCEEGHLCETCDEITNLRKQLIAAVALLTEACNYPYVELPDDWYMRAKQLGESP